MGSPFITFRQDPNADLDYVIDWTAWLDGDTIDTSIWLIETIDGDPAPLEQHGATKTGSTATVWLKSGTLNNGYNVTNRILTADGRSDDQTFRVVIRPR